MEDVSQERYIETFQTSSGIINHCATVLRLLRGTMQTTKTKQLNVVVLFKWFQWTSTNCVLAHPVVLTLPLEQDAMRHWNSQKNICVMIGQVPHKSYINSAPHPNYTRKVWHAMVHATVPTVCPCHRCFCWCPIWFWARRACLWSTTPAEKVTSEVTMIRNI